MTSGRRRRRPATQLHPSQSVAAAAAARPALHLVPALLGNGSRHLALSDEHAGVVVVAVARGLTVRVVGAAAESDQAQPGVAATSSATSTESVAIGVVRRRRVGRLVVVADAFPESDVLYGARALPAETDVLERAAAAGRPLAETDQPEPGRRGAARLGRMTVLRR